MRFDGASAQFIGHAKGQPTNWRRASFVRAIAVEETGKGAVPSHDHDHSHGKDHKHSHGTSREQHVHSTGGGCCDEEEDCCTGGEGACCAADH